MTREQIIQSILNQNAMLLQMLKNESTECKQISQNQSIPNTFDDYYNTHVVVTSGGDNTPLQIESVTPIKKKASYKDISNPCEVVKTTATDGKIYFAIKSKVYARSVARKVSNAHIKALPGVITFDESAEYAKSGKIKAWGFKLKKDAEAALATLPKIITADAQQKIRDEIDSKKA